MAVNNNQWFKKDGIGWCVYGPDVALGPGATIPVYTAAKGAMELYTIKEVLGTMPPSKGSGTGPRWKYATVETTQPKVCMGVCGKIFYRHQAKENGLWEMDWCGCKREN